jgi:glucan phosphoethanolaminetransferase (alkaline phosphatase superfamily)
MLVGTLLYSVVIGFFNDYTHVLHTRSYSITFALAIILQVLTYITFAIKKWVVKRSKRFDGPRGKFALIFGVWLVLFLSKFVFLWAIGVVFKDSVELTGFINILVVVATMTIAQKILQFIDAKLEPKNS